MELILDSLKYVYSDKEPNIRDKAAELKKKLISLGAQQHIREAKKKFYTENKNVTQEELPPIVHLRAKYREKNSYLLQDLNKEIIRIIAAKVLGFSLAMHMM